MTKEEVKIETSSQKGRRQRISDSDSASQRSQTSCQETTKRTADPSQIYLSNPRQAPVVQRAVQFFSNKLKSFPIHLGPLKNWRTVAKLAVRRSQSYLLDSLFPIHINCYPSPTVQLITLPLIKPSKSCKTPADKGRYTAFEEKTGQGQLRHVAITVERATGAVQVTLVWNTPESDDCLDDSVKN